MSDIASKNIVMSYLPLCKNATDAECGVSRTHGGYIGPVILLTPKVQARPEPALRVALATLQSAGPAKTTGHCDYSSKDLKTTYVDISFNEFQLILYNDRAHLYGKKKIKNIKLIKSHWELNLDFTPIHILKFVFLTFEVVSNL